jgi:hypothetical protein
LVISPRDIDEETGELAVAPFEKVFETGVSVLRACASDQDCIQQAEDILPHKSEQPAKTVHAITEAQVFAIRSLLDNAGERIFCVYDQVVPRRQSQAAPITTHAGVFARRPPKGDGRKPVDGSPPLWQLRKDYAGLLYDLFSATKINPVDFRGHVFEEQNAKAAKGGYAVDP